MQKVTLLVIFMACLFVTDGLFLPKINWDKVGKVLKGGSKVAAKLGEVISSNKAARRSLENLLQPNERYDLQLLMDELPMY